jgi:hypothetical protein
MYDKAQEIAFAFVLSAESASLKRIVMTPFAWPVISLGLFFCTTKSKHNLLYHYSFYLVDQTDFLLIN